MAQAVSMLCHRLYREGMRHVPLCLHDVVSKHCPRCLVIFDSIP